MAHTPNPPVQGRLISHLAERSAEDQGSGWSALWDSNESDLWDRGSPSIALVDVIEQQKDIFSPFTPDRRRKRALVPGCGRGYDPVMLALHGFDVYGLDISATGVSEARKYASSEMQSPQGYNFSSGTAKAANIGNVKFIAGDFFSSEWESEALRDGEKFDLIYDYTFLCALHPSVRQKWAERMSHLLHPGGLLVCLEFPMYKDPSLPGPPWGLKGVHWDLLARGGDGIRNIAEEEEDDAKAAKLTGQFRRAHYFRPARSYPSGKGTDMLTSCPTSASFWDYPACSAAGKVAHRPAIVFNCANEHTSLITYPVDNLTAVPDLAAVLEGDLTDWVSRTANSTLPRNQQNIPVYRYQHAGQYPNLNPFRWLGAYHASDLPMNVGSYPIHDCSDGSLLIPQLPLVAKVLRFGADGKAVQQVDRVEIDGPCRGIRKYDQFP
ncbi:thiopurine S-methyltransferase family protein [Aspergillus costaricaensis CBS 115574]|uniref:Thiopurine S-methyltransferase family protein n=1 Tax=Aspergillus costaricaensis CBS 115574 TaxID=1448317 RepID=A0ACD1I4J3_9EURO|nr:thiopurine S-methyltransferase family protein [Aspergillus costaricaensis CBS 115574]RAK84922.1 thiopurine S-methyltransferase family protein [Aspergillus costaricaensis CBS 115574]